MQVICEVPSLPDWDEMYLRPWTPLMACSSGVVTDDSTASALAPV